MTQEYISFISMARENDLLVDKDLIEWVNQNVPAVNQNLGKWGNNASVYLAGVYVSSEDANYCKSKFNIPDDTDKI